MIDIEKCREGLRCCWNLTKEENSVLCRCSECPYNDGKGTTAYCHAKLMEDARLIVDSIGGDK